jgi:hypothetical protein
MFDFEGDAHRRFRAAGDIHQRIIERSFKGNGLWLATQFFTDPSAPANFLLAGNLQSI